MSQILGLLLLCLVHWIIILQLFWTCVVFLAKTSSIPCVEDTTSFSFWRRSRSFQCISMTRTSWSEVNSSKRVWIVVVCVYARVWNSSMRSSQSTLLSSILKNPQPSFFRFSASAQKICNSTDCVAHLFHPRARASLTFWFSRLRWLETKALTCSFAISYLTRRVFSTSLAITTSSLSLAFVTWNNVLIVVTFIWNNFVSLLIFSDDLVFFLFHLLLILCQVLLSCALKLVEEIFQCILYALHLAQDLIL